MKSAYEFNKEKLRKAMPSMSFVNGDLAAWKTSAREKLTELLGLDRFVQTSSEIQIEYEQQCEGVKEIRFTFQSEAGYRVPCHLFLPQGVVKPPVMLCIQGHSRGMHVSMGKVHYEDDWVLVNQDDQDFCVQAVANGFAAVALEQRNFGECGHGQNSGPQCFESAMTALLTGRTTIGERVWDICRLIDVLETEFSDDLDMEKLCCVGHSGGGTAVIYTAALEDRIKLVMPSCAMCTFKDSIGAMHHCACNYVPQIANYFEMSDLMAMAYPKFFIQVSGEMDEIFPVHAAEEVFNAGRAVYAQLGAEERCKLLIGKGGHRFFAAQAWPAVHQFMKGLEELS